MLNDLVCLPAIDIRNGKCVRLLRGDFAKETVYGDPIDQAKRYLDDGATWLHVVDLDAARTGVSENRSLIVSMIELDGAKVEVGGGIRDESIAAFYLSAGAHRVIIGTAAIESPKLVESLVARYPHGIGLGLDHRLVGDPAGERHEVAVRGWQSTSGITLDEAVARVESIGISALIVTDIARDGALVGPDLDGYEHLLQRSLLPLIASGGVKGKEDIEALARLQAGGRYLEGVVIGRALLSGAMTLAEAIAACAR